MEPRETSDQLRAGARPLRLRLADALGNFCKVLAMYPPTNSRVVKSLDEFCGLFAEVQGLGKPRPIRVVFGNQHLRIDGEEHEIASSGATGWLKERLDRTALVGVELAASLRRDSIVTFSRLLLDNYASANQASNFESMWERAPDDLLPVERRFDGDFTGIEADLDFDGSVGQQNFLAGTLAAEDSIQMGLERLKQALETDQDGPTLSIDLLEHITRLLPADVMTDLPRVVKMTNKIIEEVFARLEGVEPALQSKEPEERKLERMLASVAQNFFGRSDATLAEVEPDEPVVPTRTKPDGGKGHKGDDAISDSLEEMLAEFDQLPNFDPHVSLFRPEDSYAEQVGVFLHYYLQDETELRLDVLEGHILNLLASGVPSVRGVLVEYVDILRSTQGRQSIHSGRLTGLLRKARQTALLRARGVTSEESVVDSFPTDFGIYIDSLDLADEELLEELLSVCRRVGEERIVANGHALVQSEQLLEFGRVERVLSLAEEALSPLARVALVHGSDSHRELVVNYLRSLEIRDDEACLLYLCEGLEYFPREYLAALIDRTAPDDQRKRAKLRRWVSMMLCRYVRNDMNPEVRRIHAIRLLVEFWEDEAEELLQGLARSAIFGRSNTSPELRKAARSALAAMGVD